MTDCCKKGVSLNPKPAFWEILSAPVNVTWEITGQCNLECNHCLSKDFSPNEADGLNLSQCCCFIDELDRLKVFQINFGGGEPFLRRDFPEILAYAHSKGIVTCVSTNGTVHDADLVKRLKGMEPLRVQISLDGATASTNDAIRGPGTFDRIIEGIELFVRHGFANLSINTVVTRINFGEIESLCRLASHYGVKSRLSRFRPAGMARDVWQDYHLDNYQLIELAQFLNSHREILTGDSFFPITDENRRDLGLNGCGAARMTCCVQPDGRVYPCAFLQDKAFLGGSILQQSLQTIWLHSPAFKMLRSVRVDACKDCTRFSFCRGGCPAVGYFFSSSLGHPDPECLPVLQGEVSYNVGTV